MNWHALSWIINEECNLHCAHCYPSSTDKKKTFLKSKDISRISENLRCMSFDKIYISGGEPLLCENISSYLDIASSIAQLKHLLQLNYSTKSFSFSVDRVSLKIMG